MKLKFIPIFLILMLLPALASAAVFSDVSEDDWFYADVLAMYEQGIVYGKGNNVFDPSGTLTYAEALKLAVAARDAVYADITIPDIVGSHWVDPYYETALEIGITGPLSADAFDAPIERSGMFSFFARVLNEGDYTPINDITLRPFSSSVDPAASDPDIIKLYNSGIVIGSSNGFETDRTVTRAEAAALIHRVVEASARQRVETDEPEFEYYQLELLELVNASRAADGKDALILDADLCRVAQQLAVEYSQGASENRRLNGDTTLSLLKEYGLGMKPITENYGKGPSATAAYVHNNWMNTFSSKIDILRATHKYLGVGMARVGSTNYWVEVFSPF